MISLAPFVVSILLLAALFKIAFIFHVLYVLIAVAVLARIWSHYSANRVRFERRFEERGIFGDQVRVEIEIRNRGLLPVPWMRIHDRLPAALAAPATFDRALSLGPGESATFGYDLSCRQRGWYELGPFTIETGDVLGLNIVRREYRTDSRLTVYPRIVGVGALGLPSRTPFGDIRTSRPLYEDPSRTIGVRDYQSGDSLRRIHWSATAAVGRLQVRKLEPAMTLHTTVILDLSLEGYERSAGYYATELAITTAASVASHLVNQRQEIGLTTNARDPGADAAGWSRGHIAVPAGKGHAHLTQILDVLARAEAHEAGTTVDLINATMGDLGWGSTVVVICGRQSAELTGALGRLRKAGLAVALVLITHYSPYREGTSAAPPGVPVYHVWRESELEHTGGSTPGRRAATAAR